MGELLTFVAATPAPLVSVSVEDNTVQAVVMVLIDEAPICKAHKVPTDHAMVAGVLQGDLKNIVLVRFYLQVTDVLSPHSILQEPLWAGPCMRGDGSAAGN